MRSFADAAAIGTPGLPKGQPLPSVRSMRSPSSCGFHPTRSAGRLHELVGEEWQRANPARLVIEGQGCTRLDLDAADAASLHRPHLAFEFLVA